MLFYCWRVVRPFCHHFLPPPRPRRALSAGAAIRSPLPPPPPGKFAPWAILVFFIKKTRFQPPPPHFGRNLCSNGAKVSNWRGSVLEETGSDWIEHGRKKKPMPPTSPHTVQRQEGFLTKPCMAFGRVLPSSGITRKHCLI